MPMVDPMSMQPRPPPPPPPPTTDSPSDGKSGPNFYEAMSMVDFPNGIISHGGSGKYKPKPKPAPMPTIPKRRTLLGLNFPEPTGTCLPTPDDSPEDVISHGGSGKYKPKPKPAPLPTIPERRTCLGHNFCDLTGTCPPKPEPGPLPLPFGPPPTDPPLPLDLERYSSDDGMNMDEHIPDGPMPPRRPWIEPIPPSARPKPQPNPRPDYYYADDKRDGLCFEGVRWTG
ncbi:hypothetical protein GE09DRAFT_1150126 [Coniochaeta sp. 2T2.1]|nr:hypothetical protein GE09DRAFT_1150126 [Coniochaeta sp. 2T2.1]